MRRSLLAVLGLTLVACGSQAVAPTAQPQATPTALAQATAVAPSPTLAPLPTAPPAASPPAAPIPTATPATLTADPISGRTAFARGALTSRPLVVMIDNHPDAYPQTGLDEATLVFEALAEYGVTRYMAVYAPDIAPVKGDIGPVRSARIYFVQWAMGMRAVYAHAGGSPAGLERLIQDGNNLVINLDAIEKGVEYVYARRDSGRQAPHNLYISQAEIQRYVADRTPNSVNAELAEVGYLFEPDAPQQAAAKPINSIGYYFLYADDPVAWSYDPTGNRYFRLRRNRPHTDAVSGEQLWFKSLAVMQVDEAPIPGDPKGRIDQNVIGAGAARIFANGTTYDAIWKKDSEEGPVRFFDPQGTEIRFPAGPLWVAAVPDLAHLTFSE